MNNRNFNWRQSPSHIWLLTTFLSPREPDDNYLDVDWRRALGEAPSAAIYRFLKLVFITEAPLIVRLEAQYTADELKELCRQYDLPTSGRKGELATRLFQTNDPIIYSDITIEMYQCTDKGRELVEKYLADAGNVIHQNDQYADEPSESENKLTSEELTRILRWLLLEEIILGIAGNAAYDLLKAAAESTGKKITDIFRDFKLPDKGQVTCITFDLKIEWCHVPTGRFLMGSTDRDPDAQANEKPQHYVHLPGFQIARYPITNRQYAAFIRATRHHVPWGWKDGQMPHGKNDHPVTNVSLQDAETFCAWATRISGNRIRLPTEAEWEKAARGTDGRLYPWGNYWDANRCNGELRIGGTTPVDRFPSGRSPYGLFDMIGNAWEWTSSHFTDYPNLVYRSFTSQEKSNDWFMLKGGSYWSVTDWLRCAARNRDIPISDFDRGYGFRVVVSPF